MKENHLQFIVRKAKLTEILKLQPSTISKACKLLLHDSDLAQHSHHLLLLIRVISGLTGHGYSQRESPKTHLYQVLTGGHLFIF